MQEVSLVQASSIAEQGTRLLLVISFIQYSDQIKCFDGHFASTKRP